MPRKKSAINSQQLLKTRGKKEDRCAEKRKVIASLLLLPSSFAFFLFFTSVFLFLGFILSSADVIYLTNGKIVEGETCETSPGMFMIKGKGGSITVNKNMILRIVRRDETQVSRDIMIEIGSLVKKEDAEKLRAAVVALSISESQVRIVDEAPYYKVQVGPFHKETEAIPIAQRIDAAKLPNAYSTGSRVFQTDISAISGLSAETVKTTAEQETNIALSVNGARAIADSSLPGYPAMNAIDGNQVDFNSRWISDTSASFNSTPDKQLHWLEIDFGKSKPFSRIELYTGEATRPSAILSNFALQYWNGSEWNDIAVRTNNLIENPQFIFSEITAQKVRLYVTRGSHTDNQARVFEIKVFSEQSLPEPGKEFSRVSLVERKYQIRPSLVQAGTTNFLAPGTAFSVKTAEWYTVSCTVSYLAPISAVLSASILPDATEFWTNAELRTYLDLTPDDYNTTINFDTQRTPGYSNVEGSGELSFTLKAKAPRLRGTYPKTLRISLLQIETRNSLVFQEIPFTLQVEQ